MLLYDAESAERADRISCAAGTSKWIITVPVFPEPMHGSASQNRHLFPSDSRLMETSPPSAPEDLSLHEMLQVMDVARTLRKEQQTVEQEFNREETVELLREKLLASAEITGDMVTPEEVDAAINLYFDNLHTFREPAPGVSTVLAHVYIWRRRIASALCLLLCIGLLGWWLFFASTGPFSKASRTHRAIATHMPEIERASASIRTVSRQPDVTAQVERLEQEANIARDAGDINRLAELQQRLTQLEARLLEEYEVRIVSGAGEQSGVDRYLTDSDGTRTSGDYVIVQAKAPDGEVLSRTIQNAETGREERVTVWAERVPAAVYNRIKADKQEDGILNETLFALKRRGDTDEQVVLPGEDGTPLNRDSQITRW